MIKIQIIENIFQKQAYSPTKVVSILIAVLSAVLYGALFAWASSSVSTFLLVIMLLISPIIIRKLLIAPEWSLSLLVGGNFFWNVIPDRINELLTGYRIPITILFVLIIHMVGFWGARESRRSRKPQPIEITLLVFLGLMALSLQWSSEQAYGFWKTALFGCTSFSIFIATWRYYSIFTERLSKLIRVIAIVSLVPISIFLMLAVEASGVTGLVTVYSYDVRNLVSEQSSYTGIATILMLSIPLTLASAWMTKERLHKIFYYSILILSIYTILLNGRRLSFVIAVMSIFLMYLIFDVQHRHLFTRLFFFGISIFAGITILLTLNPRFAYEPVTEDISFINRLAAYRVTMYAFWDQPFWGTGIGGYGEIFNQYSAKSGSVITYYTTSMSNINRSFAHNIFSEVLSELGIIGLLLLSINLVYIFRYLGIGWKIAGDPKVKHALRLTIAGGMVSTANCLMLAQFSGDLGSLSIGLWLGILVAAVETHKMSHTYLK